MVLHEFSTNKGKLFKTGAYIEGDSAVFTFAAEKRMNAALFYLINREILPV